MEKLLAITHLHKKAIKKVGKENASKFILVTKICWKLTKLLITYFLTKFLV